VCPDIDSLIKNFDAGRFAAVIEQGSSMLTLYPTDARLLLICARAHLELDEPEQAVVRLQCLLQAEPQNSEAWHAMGRAFRAVGDTAQSMQAFSQVPKESPLYIGSQVELAGFFRSKGDFGRAQGILQDLCGAFPADVRPLHALASVEAASGDLEEAITLAEKAFSLDAASIRSLFLAADCARLLGKQQQSRKLVRQILLIAPRHPVAGLMDTVNSIPHIYQSEVEIESAREQYAQSLDRLDTLLAGQAVSKAVCQAFSQGMYSLPYQGQNDRHLQEKYGDIAIRLHRDTYPQWSRPLSMPSLEGRIRVGFVSAFFNLHSNWRIPIKGWVSQLNRDEFEIFGYSVSHKHDDATEHAARIIEHFAADLVGFEELAETIRADNLHVLIFPEIGMSADVSRLAMLRLAPVQCSSWGHPNTSGFSTIDYFLSSRLMEPENGQEAYSETLVELPNCSVYLEPDIPPAESLAREELGLRDSATVYLCSQYLCKYLPQFDALLVDIAAAVPDSQFVFLQGTKMLIYEALALRIRKAFEAVGLDYEHHVCWLPYLSGERFRGLQQIADVFLDTEEWSGCNTAVEAIHYDLPIVTLPGHWMRGRHCFAFLKQMGLEDTIASSREEYVRLAVRLAIDVEFRKHIVKQIQANKHRLFCDDRAISGLEEFLRDAVGAG